jgi:hypothetical protein
MNSQRLPMVDDRHVREGPQEGQELAPEVPARELADHPG